MNQSLSKKIIIGLLATGSLMTATTFTSEAQWQAAMGGTIVTETFAGDQITTGLQIQTCSQRTGACGAYDGGGGYYGGISNNQFQDSIGGADFSYRETKFILPTGSDGVGFWISVPAQSNPPDGPFQLTLFEGTTIQEIDYPAGGAGFPNEVMSGQYRGFFGVTTASPVDAFELSGLGGTYTLDDAERDPPALTPEPLSMGLVGLGLLMASFVSSRFRRRES